MVLELPSRAEGYTVKNDMVMYVVSIQMRSNYNLIFIAPHTLGCFYSDTVRFLRCYLACLKALIPVIGHGAILFAVLLLYSQHFLAGSAGKAVDARHKTL